MAAFGALIANAAAAVWARISGWVVAAAAGAAVLLAVWLKGRADGKADAAQQQTQQQAKQAQQRADAVVERKQVDDQVAAAPAADVDARLDQWMRD